MVRPLTKCMLAVGVVCLLTAIASAQITTPVPDVFFVNYFSNAGGATDGTVRIVNPGLYDNGVGGIFGTRGDLCALIYVFDQDQQQLACCGCKLTPNAVRQLSVNTDLTANTLTGDPLPDGAIKIISHAPTAAGNCARSSGAAIAIGPITTNPSYPAPEPTLRSWITHPQGGTLTEEEFLEVPLTELERRRLNFICTSIQTNASGAGVCTCGTGGG